MSHIEPLSEANRHESIAWRPVVSALCANLIGLGLARFAYAPLLPAIVANHWFAPSAAAYIGAANLSGYLAGALLANPIAARVNTAALLRAMMALATLTFFACAWRVDFTWFFVWRFFSGLSGGVLMVLAATTVLQHVTPSRRGLVGGTIFVGVGFGIAASGTLVPLLLRQGLVETWIGLGVLSALLTLVGWGGWPQSPAAEAGATPHHHAVRSPLRLKILYGAYALNAIGLVPHMLFLVDYVARGRGEGLDAGAHYWVIYGLGACVGPALAGMLADRTGFGPAVRLAFLVQALAVGILAFGVGPVGLIVSTVITGAFTPGIVALVLGRVHELLAHHPAGQKQAWSRATTSFAILQAVAAYGMSFIFSQGEGNYHLLFAIGAGALVVALLADLITGVIAKPAID